MPGFESVKDTDEQAAVHRYIGLAYFLLKDNDRAREAFNAEFLLMKAKNLTMLAMVRKSPGAMELWDPELVQKQERILASPSLDSLEMVWEWLTFASIAGWDAPFLDLAQSVFRANGDVAAAQRMYIATVLQLTAELGIANEYLAKLLKQNEVKTEAPKQKTKAEEAASFQQSGKFDTKRDSRKALGSFQKALGLRREIGDRQGTAETLVWLGDVWFSLNENRKALDCYTEARGIQLALGNHLEEAEALSEIGIVHNWIGERRKALEFYGQALVLFREAKQRASQAKDKAGEAKARAGETTALYHMGESYFLLGEKQKALEHLDQAQAASRDASYPDGDPATLSLIGLVYASLSDQPKSQDYYRRAVTGFQRKLTGGLTFYNLKEKGVLYNELGDAYHRLGQTQEAVGTFLRGLVFQKEFGNRSEQAYALNRVGEIYLASRDPQERGKALASFQQALELRRQDGNPSRKAEALHNLGSAYEALGDRQKALPMYHQALAIRHRLKDPEAAGETLDELMRVSKSLNQPRLAIYYGKQAVNALQQIRLNIQGLDKDIQKSFLNSRSGTYRELADLLITEGRLPEAQQVLDLLKKDEFLEFIRREGPQDASGAAVLSVREAQQELRFRQIQDRVVAAGERFAIVTAQENPTAEERQEMSRLERELSAANDAYERYLTGLPLEFAASGKGDSTAEALREAKGLQETLRELGDHTVALYTVVTGTQYHVILFTPETQIARSYPIQPADLNRKVQEFRTVLLNPNLDPVPLAQELYKILVGPVAKDLADAHAKTLMWSLDGTLRYVPISALHDGAGYLMEKYRIAVFTPASRSRLEKPPTAKWRGLGLGVSKGAIPLPYVSEELQGIIHDSADPASSEGVVAGKILLDDSFTKTAMKEALLRGRSYPLVHVASHFRFKPGNEFDSYLLLGGEEKDSDEKRHLTLAEIKSGTNIFRGVELLTLSACNTAVGSGEGAEIENFAVLAQLKGARAVVATLWPVDDRSTMRLMQTFYRLRNDSPGQPKVEALRQAQLSLLRGATAAYAHPYFWAPFILIGNWR